MNILIFLTVILSAVVIINLLNDKFFHLQSDIAVLLFSIIFCFIILVVCKILNIYDFEIVINVVSSFNLEEYLLDGVLCLMIFAGSSKLNMRKFKQNLKTILFLSFISTAISSIIFGLLFWQLCQFVGINIDIWIAIMLGCIVSPTDPIAATGILNKLGISKNLLSVIESESLFNDGTGVALFIFVSRIVTSGSATDFFMLMFKEIVGAILAGLLISYIMFKFVKKTDKPVLQIVLSIVTVSIIYIVCEYFGFSGVIGSVICGMVFAYNMNKIERQREVYDSQHIYENFWSAIDSILNSVLFVMIGISVLSISPYIGIGYIFLIGIFSLLLSRFTGILSSFFVSGGRNIPGQYDLVEFAILMTWTALKGGLSLALALSTKNILSPEMYEIVINTTYMIIVFTVIVQGLSIKPVYNLIEKHKINRKVAKK